MELKEVVERVKDALRNAKSKILELSGTIDRLTAQPRVYVSVVGIRNPEGPRTAPPEAFTVGTKVFITAVRNGARRQVINTEGTIIDTFAPDESDEYDVRVRSTFEDVEYDYGIGVSRGHNWRGEQRTPVELMLAGRPGGVTVIQDGKRIELALPKDFTAKVGDTVAISPKTMQIIEKVTDPGVGETVFVRQAIDATSAEVDWQGSSRVVVFGDATPPKKGDRVILDPTASAIVRNLGKEDERFAFRSSTNVSWNDIGGLEDAKQQMREAVEHPVTRRALYAKYNQPAIKGVLLHGPPRCGKTMFGKAAATAIARLYNADPSKALFLYVKGPEILEKFVGVAEGAIRNMFGTLRNHKAEHGVPGVLFIDEADAIMYKRGTGISSDVERTIVPAFLAEMDGLDETAGLVILATNRPDVLDPAIVGDGRMDRRIYISRPDRAATETIFRMYLAKTALAPGLNSVAVAAYATETLFKPGLVVRELVVKNGSVTTIPLVLSSIVNGAMIMNVVTRATAIAIERDTASGSFSGVGRSDLDRAISDTLTSVLQLNHDDDIRDIADRLPQGTKVIGLRQVQAQA